MSNQLTARDFAKYEWVLSNGIVGAVKEIDLYNNTATYWQPEVEWDSIEFSEFVFSGQPILRPLSDMSEEECIEAWSLMSGQEKNLTHVFLFRQYLDDKCWPERPNLQRMLDMSSFLDSRQLDIRDLIDQGLAVSRHEFPNLKYSFEKGGSDE